MSPPDAIFQFKYIKMSLRPGASPRTPLVELVHSPDAVAGLQGEGRAGKGKAGKGRSGKEREEKLEKGREGKGRGENGKRGGS